MTAFAALTYGFLASFILSAASRNNKLQRAHPPVLIYVGYMLCGLSLGASVILGVMAVRHFV